MPREHYSTAPEAEARRLGEWLAMAWSESSHAQPADLTCRQVWLAGYDLLLEEVPTPKTKTLASLPKASQVRFEQEHQTQLLAERRAMKEWHQLAEWRATTSKADDQKATSSARDAQITAKRDAIHARQIAILKDQVSEVVQTALQRATAEWNESHRGVLGAEQLPNPEPLSFQTIADNLAASLGYVPANTRKTTR